MEGPKPLDPPPCSDLQMELVLCMDLEDTMDGCGSMGDVGNIYFNIVALGSDGPPGFPLDGGQKLENGALSGWKNSLVGSSVANISMKDPKIAHGIDGPVISLPNSLVENVTFGIKLYVVGRFVAFRPTIEMVRKWVS